MSRQGVGKWVYVCVCLRVNGGWMAWSTSHFANPKCVCLPHTQTHTHFDWRREACITSGSWVHKLDCVCVCVSVRGWLAGIPHLTLPEATMIAFLPLWTCVIVSVELSVWRCVHACVFLCQAHTRQRNSLSHTLMYTNTHTHTVKDTDRNRMIWIGWQGDSDTFNMETDSSYHCFPMSNWKYCTFNLISCLAITFFWILLRAKIHLEPR